ncbi:IQ-DOMAIN 31-like protein [Tanacetum coccineum]
MNKDKVNIDNSNAKTKKRWSFGKCMKDLSQRVTVENDSTRMRSCMSALEKEQNKHANSVAATTAAVAGAQAAVAVARLTSDGRDTLFSARRAMRALKGLVKFQALVRGFLVRKQVAATLYSMQALLRAQLAVRSKRAELAVRYQLAVQPEIRHRKSTARKALRALKGLVKFQALFRGFLVRKRVAATLYSMQALLRAQLAVRSKRAELAVRYQLAVQPEIRHGESTVRSLL